MIGWSKMNEKLYDMTNNEMLLDVSVWPMNQLKNKDTANI